MKNNRGFELGLLAVLGLLAEKNDSVYPDGIAESINFELRNRTSHPIGVSVSSRGKKYLIDQKNNTMDTVEKTGAAWVAVGQGLTLAVASVDTTKPTTVQVSKSIVDGIPSVITTYQVADSSGKTRFLSYDDTKNPSLYPQAGPLKGIGKFTPNFIMKDVTETGLLKRNNVTQKDIASK